MSIQTEISRIAQNVSNTYTVLSALGADMPTEQTSDNLASTAGTAKAVLYSEQTLTESQKAQARTNIGAASESSVQDAYDLADAANTAAANAQTTADGKADPSDIPTKTSELANDSGFITSSDIPTKTSELTNDSGFVTASAVPTKTSQLTNDSGFLTSHQDISGKLDKSGGTMTGVLTAQNNTSYTTKQVRNIFLIADGASLPSGANGDICLVYTP